jgi:hypothetical protein
MVPVYPPIYENDLHLPEVLLEEMVLPVSGIDPSIPNRFKSLPLSAGFLVNGAFNKLKSGEKY